MGKIRGRRRAKATQKKLGIDDAVEWNREPEGSVDDCSSFPIPPNRTVSERRRLDRQGRIVDYAVVLTEDKEELIRADMSHGYPEIHVHGGKARRTGGQITSFDDVQRSFDRDYEEVLRYAGD